MNNLYEKPILFSKKQLTLMLKGKILTIGRKGMRQQFGIKGTKEMRIKAKIEELKQQLKQNRKER